MNLASRRPPVRLAVAALLTALVAVPLPSPPAAALTAYDITTATESRRVDSVPTPVLGWYACGGRYQCATVPLPLDYDDPTGPQVEVALMRLPARKPARRIGTLFLNPGGPGASGIELVGQVQGFVSLRVLDRFDVIGFDPRGVGYSDAVRCFPTSAAQAPVLTELSRVPFPYGAAGEKTFLGAQRRLGRACSTAGQPLSVSMSTAQVARDLDVLRRAVGDERLTYLGLSYGSYLGQVYANLFPDRVRALALDGILDPVAWAGTAATDDRPISSRIRSAEASARALRTLLVRCDKAGTSRCSFAAGDPVANFDRIASRLKRRPVVATDPFTGEDLRFGYPDLVASVLSALYFSDAGEYIASLMSELEESMSPGIAADRATRVRSGVRLGKVLAELAERGGPAGPGWGFPYDNGFEAKAAVACTDSLNPVRLSSLPAEAAAAERRARHFGRIWVWSLGFCADDAFSGRDEDAYRGRFSRRTFAPLLFLGNYWDPATAYTGAERAAELAPYGVLVPSDSWGHTAYTTSVCATKAVDDYLLAVRTPKPGTVCVGDDQPFAGDEFGAAPAQRALRSVGAG